MIPDRDNAGVSRFAKIVMWFAILEPILGIYGWQHYTLAHMLTLLLCIVYLIRNSDLRRFRHHMPKLLAVYFLYWLVVYLFWIRSIGGLVPKLLLLFFVSYMMLFKEISLPYFLQAYKRFVIIIIAFFYIQEISFALIGQRPPGIAFFLPLNESAMAGQGYGWVETLMTYSRSASFFREPAHFAQAIIPLLPVIIYDPKLGNSRKLLWVIYMVVPLVLCQSGNALFGLGVISFIYCCYVLFKMKGIKKIISTIVLVLFFGMGAYWVRNSNASEKLMERQSEISYDTVEQTSGFIRIFRGYFVFAEYSFGEKIFGIDNDQILATKIAQSKVAVLFSEKDRYFNGVQEILLRTGFVGLIIMILMLAKLWKGNCVAGKTFICLAIMFSLISSNFMSISFAIYLILAQRIQAYFLGRSSGNAQSII